RIEDIGAGARRTGALRPNINRDRNGRPEDRLDDRPHRRIEPARRIELDDDERRAFFLCALDSADEVIGRRGPDSDLHREQGPAPPSPAPPLPRPWSSAWAGPVATCTVSRGACFVPAGFSFDAFWAAATHARRSARAVNSAAVPRRNAQGRGSMLPMIAPGAE